MFGGICTSGEEIYKKSKKQTKTNSTIATYLKLVSVGLD